MKKISSFVLLMSLFISSPAFSAEHYTDGNRILSACNELFKIFNSELELDSFDAGKCWGYISASTDIFQIVQYESSRIACIPEDTEVSKLVRILIEYLNDHPKDLDRPAFVLISNAFSKEFPCAKPHPLPQKPSQ